MFLLPAPRIAGLLPAVCPPAGCEPDPYPYKAITITTAHGSVKVNGYADIGAELARLMQVPVTIIERTQVDDWRLSA